MPRSARVALVLLSLAAGPLAAQEIRAIDLPERAGFWWGLGAGGASAQLLCATCGGPQYGSVTFPMVQLQVGFTASPNLAFGIEANGGTKKDGFYGSDAVTENVGDIDLSAYYYPSATGNIWIQAGVGLSGYQATQGADHVRTTGSALILGAGYDLHLGRDLSLTPNLRVIAGAEGDLKDQDGNVAPDQWKVGFLQAGLSLVWH